jgi:hypothetical protein
MADKVASLAEDAWMFDAGDEAGGCGEDDDGDGPAAD